MFFTNTISNTGTSSFSVDVSTPYNRIRYTGGAGIQITLTGGVDGQLIMIQNSHASSTQDITITPASGLSGLNRISTRQTSLFIYSSQRSYWEKVTGDEY